MISNREENSSPDNDDDYYNDHLINENQNVTVKFQISETQIIAQVYPNSITLNEIKNDIAFKFNINPIYLKIIQANEELAGICKLSDVYTNEYGIIEFELKLDENLAIENGENKPELNLQFYYSKFRLPDFITVHIPTDIGVGKNVVVEIQNQAIKKPFLGGYRDPKTDIEYLDAYTQTGPPLEKIKFYGIYSRDVQTVECKDKMINTLCDTSTQAFGDRKQLIYFSSENDRYVIPRKYESYKDKCRRENKEKKIILIQRNLRRYILWKNIKKCAALYRRLVEEENRRNNKILENDAKYYQRKIISKTFPRSTEDFNLLYAQVQKWKETEIKKINTTYTGESRIAQLGLLLDKEIQLLNGIEKKKNFIRKTLKEYYIEKKLTKLGEPVKWVGYRDIVIEMDLLRTQKIRYLTEYYKEMKKNYNVEKRIKLLNEITELLENEENLPETYELLELFEREKSLLVLLNNKCSLETLRKRELVLFMQIIEYNSDQQKSKKEKKRMCEKCKKIKSVQDFALRTRQNTTDTCKRCFYLKGTASDNSFYIAILRTIQREERKKGGFSSYAFIMQEDDIRYIIDVIWHGHSILSKCDDVSNLRLPRWDKNEEWSPWNCICLTEIEMRAHINIKNLNDVYKDTIINDIKAKHLTAKNAFRKLIEVDRDYVDSGEWWEVGISELIV